MLMLIVSTALLLAGHSQQMPWEEDCNLKPEGGHCKRALARFFYDPDTGTCKEFSYGGCGGNANNFKTKAECEETCVPDCHEQLENEASFVPRF